MSLALAEDQITASADLCDCAVRNQSTKLEAGAAKYGWMTADVYRPSASGLYRYMTTTIQTSIAIITKTWATTMSTDAQGNLTAPVHLRLTVTADSRHCCIVT